MPCADLSQADELLAQLEASLANDQQDLAKLGHDFQHASEGATAEKVELAKSEQRLEGLHLRLAQFEDDSREREQSLASGHEQLRILGQRQENSEAEILALSAELAHLYLQKESSIKAVDTCALRARSNHRSAANDSAAIAILATEDSQGRAGSA